MILPKWRSELHAYLGGIVRTLGGFPAAVGGISDHVHMLIGLKAAHRLSDVMRELKAGSSRWVHEEANDRSLGAVTIRPGAGEVELETVGPNAAAAERVGQARSSGRKATVASRWGLHSVPTFGATSSGRRNTTVRNHFRRNI